MRKAGHRAWSKADANECGRPIVLAMRLPDSLANLAPRRRPLKAGGSAKAGVCRVQAISFGRYILPAPNTANRQYGMLIPKAATLADECIGRRQQLDLTAS